MAIYGQTPLWYKDSLDILESSQMFWILNKAVSANQPFLYELDMCSLNKEARVMLKCLLEYYGNRKQEELYDFVKDEEPLATKLVLSSRPKANAGFREMNLYI